MIAGLLVSATDGAEPRANDDFTTTVKGTPTSAPADHFATTIETDQVPSLAAPSVSELVASTPGATVRRTGGPGDFATLSIRGSASTQAAIYLDGVLINSAGVGTVDLSTLLMSDLSRVVVHRGFTPLSFGPDGFFGALEMTSPRPRGFSLMGFTSVGAFGSRQLGVSVAESSGPFAIRIAALYSGKTGDFHYHDDNGTPLNLTDDGLRARTNNDQNLGQLNVDVRLWKWRLSLATFGKEQGAATPVNVRDNAARFAMWRPILNLSHEPLYLAPGWSISTRLSHIAQVSETKDFGNDEQAWESDSRLSAAVRVQPADWWTLEAGPFLATQAFAVRRPIDTDDAGGESRERHWVGGFIDGSVLFFAHRLQLSVGTRLDAAFDKGLFAQSLFTRQTVLADTRQRVLVQPQARISLTPVTGLTVLAQLSRRARVPTFYELFGSDGRIRGNPALNDEAQLTLDGGARYHHEFFSAEAAYAFTQAEQLVVMVQNGQELPQAQNVGRATIHTVEASLAARPLRWLSTSLAYTFQDAKNGTKGVEQGKPLSGRPAHQGRFGITGYAPNPIKSSLTLEISYIGGAYLDRVATRQAPERWPVNLRLMTQIASSPIFVQFEVTNLFDQLTQPRAVAALQRSISVPIVDFVGYPLPGRAAFISLVYALGDRQRALGDSLCNASC